MDKPEKETKKRTSQKSVLVTGASTGIGWAISLELANRDWRVFSAVRKDTDAKKLREASSGKITPVIMDIVDYESVKKGAGEIEKMLGGAGLDALFNNAGISVQGPMEIIPIEMFEQQIRVNVFGHLFVTQTFLPLIRKAKGNIVFMSSESGRVTLPLVGPYSASKFALEAVANALRVELLHSGIKVSLVEAATIKTPMWEKIDTTTEKVIAAAPQQARDLYEAELETLIRIPRIQAGAGIPMEKVVGVIHRAMTEPRPKARYIVGWEAWAFIYSYAVMPTRIMDWITSKMARSVGRH
jgi:NAD(P)-dependent dehydrogenase (short-subunit alcohol dehydrogenase family)